MVVLLLLGGAAWSYLRVGSLKRSLADERKAREQAVARAEGFESAIEVSDRKLRRAVKEQESLHEQYISLRDRVAGSKPVVRELVKWRTKEIEVPVEKIVEHVLATPGDCPPLHELLEKRVSFSVTGIQAAVESRAGNRWLLGDVELTRTRPGPPQFLGKAAFQLDVTEHFVSEDEVEEERWPRWALFAGWHTEGWLVGGQHFPWDGRWLRRVGFGFQMVRDSAPLSVTARQSFDNFSVSETATAKSTRYGAFMVARW